MNKENESSSAILGDVSSFHAIEKEPILSGSSLSRFIQRLDNQLAKNQYQFQHQIDQIKRGVSVSSENEKILIKKIQSLEQKLDFVQQENFQLQQTISELFNERNQMEKKLVLASNEISRLKHSKITLLNSRRRSPAPAVKSQAVDIDKYRRALLYIDELQHRLRVGN